MRSFPVLAILILSGCRPEPPDLAPLIAREQAEVAALQGRIEVAFLLLAITAGVLLITACALALLVFVNWHTSRAPRPSTPENPE